MDVASIWYTDIRTRTHKHTKRNAPAKTDKTMRNYQVFWKVGCESVKGVSVFDDFLYWFSSESVIFDSKVTFLT